MVAVTAAPCATAAATVIAAADGRGGHSGGGATHATVMAVRAGHEVSAHAAATCEVGATLGHLRLRSGDGGSACVLWVQSARAVLAQQTPRYPSHGVTGPLGYVVWLCPPPPVQSGSLNSAFLPFSSTV